MTTHTPGPWEWDGEYVQKTGQPDVGICSVLNMDEGGSKGWYHGPVTQANARLIAAAPELLSLLSEAVELQRKHYGDGMLLHLDMAEWAKKAEAAIAKATGA